MVGVVEVSGRGCIEKLQDRSDGMRAPNMLVVRKWRRREHSLLEMENLDLGGGENANTAATFVVDLVEVFEKVQLIVVWHLSTWFKFPQSLSIVL